MKQNNIIIRDSKEATVFADNEIQNNPDLYFPPIRTKDAFKTFVDKFPNVVMNYDKFWGRIKKVVEGKPTRSAAGKEIIPEVIPAQLDIRVYIPKDEDVNEEIFLPYKTNKFIDQIISKDGGCMPGTTTVVIGDPSVGKTTCTLDILYNAMTNMVASVKNKKDKEAMKGEFMYLSSEMKKIDLQSEQRDKSWMKEIRTVLLTDYTKHEYKAAIEKVILYGYRMLAIDSLQNIVEKLQMSAGMTSTEAFNFIMGLIEKANNGDTETGHITCILLIQQVTKGGTFVGKNSLKHDTTAMLEFKFDKDGDRYCQYLKNRRNGRLINKKLFYTLNENHEIVWDEKKWNEDREKDKMLSMQIEDLAEQTEGFTNALSEYEVE